MFYILNNITLYTFLHGFKIVNSLQCILNHFLILPQVEKETEY